MSTYNFTPLQSIINNWQETNIVLEDVRPDQIVCNVNSSEMLKVSPEGFWVRGVKVAQDDKEAETVYNAFKEFLVWQRLSRNENV